MEKQKRDSKTVELVKIILEKYNPENIDDMQDALKNIFGPLLENILDASFRL